MSIAPATPSLEDATALIDRELDLVNVRRKLSGPEEGVGVADAELDVMETEYRRFLIMHLVFPGSEIVPCKLVDTIWHQHILDTSAYREDCDAIFGEFLDHYPYFGMRDEAEAQQLQDAYADTIERYRECFGEPALGTWISADAAKCKRTNCKPQKCR